MICNNSCFWNLFSRFFLHYRIFDLYLKHQFFLQCMLVGLSSSMSSSQEETPTSLDLEHSFFSTDWLPLSTLKAEFFSSSGFLVISPFQDITYRNIQLGEASTCSCPTLHYDNILRLLSYLLFHFYTMFHSWNQYEFSLCLKHWNCSCYGSCSLPFSFLQYRDL